LFEQQFQPQLISPACGVEISVDVFSSLHGDGGESSNFDGDLGLAVQSGEAFWALASVVVHKIDTCAAVQARAGSAVIDVDFTEFSRESDGAVACVAGDSVNAHTTVVADSGSAIINVRLANISLVSESAFAGEFINSVNAFAAMKARRVGAVINVGGAVEAGETSGAKAFV
jgi:hypothetical protein